MTNNIEMSNYRLEQSEQCLKSAKILLRENDYKGVANRSYYCIFHAMRSILALNNIDFKKHSGVISYFRENYIKNEVFDKKLSKIINGLFELRTASDYDDFYLIGKDEIVYQTKNAEYFYEQIKNYIESLNI